MPGFSRHLFIWILFWQLVIAGCAGPQQQTAGQLKDAPVWPSYGEQTRIRYLSSFSTPEELQIHQGILSRIWGLVAGATYRCLVGPRSVSVDDTGTIYVVDGTLKNVQIYNKKTTSYSTVPDDDSPLQEPINTVMDTELGRLYITDSVAGLVRIMQISGKASFEEFGKEELTRPTGIAINRMTEELLVLDTNQAEVLRYDRHNLKIKGRFGKGGAGEGEFNRPTDLAVNSVGEILVSDSLNSRVQIFSPSGDFRRAFGRAGDNPGNFSRPKGIAVDSDDNIYVVDTLFDNIQIFDTQGALLLSFGQAGQGPGEFWMPSGIYIDQNDKIYVADTYNKRVQIFQYLKHAEHK